MQALEIFSYKAPNLWNNLLYYVKETELVSTFLNLHLESITLV